jgi:hypothetical protein
VPKVPERLLFVALAGALWMSTNSAVNPAIAMEYVETKLVATELHFGPFGEVVALSGDSLAVLSAFGRVTIFIRDGDDWVEQTTLESPEPLSDFGSALAFDGNTLAIGDPSDGGAAFVYLRNGNIWSLQKKLTSGNGRFGGSLSLQGDFLVVGAWTEDVAGTEEAGAAYVFQRSGNSWSKVAKLTAPSPGELEWFGWDVAVDQGRIAIGAPFPFTADLGHVYVYECVSGTWTLVDSVTGSDAVPLGEFGRNVALLGEILVVSDAERSQDQPPAAGAVYIFDGNSGNFLQTAKLSASDPQTVGDGEHGFGSALAIHGDRLLIGAPDYDTNVANSGAAYLFEMQDDLWTEIEKLVGSDVKSDDQFGISLAMDDGLLAAGTGVFDFDANAGAVYVFSSTLSTIRPAITPALLLLLMED